MIKIKHKRYKGLLNTKIYMVEADYNIFYKYMAINNNTLKVLKNQELYFSHTSKFNDPFDSKLDLTWSGSIEDWNSSDFFIEETLAETKVIMDSFIKNGIFEENNGLYRLLQPDEGFQTIIEKKQSKMNFPSPRVCCFSTNKKSILMWSHYADRHKGICLCFKSKQMIDNGNVLILDSDPHTFFPVEYNKNLPKQVNMLNWESEALLSFFKTKHLEWKYEDEYRLILWEDVDFQGKSTCTKRFSKEGLEGIIFGLNTPIEKIKEVHDIIKSNYLQEGIKVNFYKTQEIKGKYTINAKKIDNLDKYIQKYGK